MSIDINEKQITDRERAEINEQVQNELIEHLYQGCLPGTIAGVPVGIAIFIDFYNHTPSNLLIPWYIFYNLALFTLTTLYFIYKKYKDRYPLNNWLTAYSVTMCICAASWGIAVFLIPDNILRQYFALVAIFLIATGYATGSIGVFELCVTTVSIIMVPLMVWCFEKGGIFYNLMGFFSIIFIGFMSGINRRSTQWFKESLKLQLENNLVSYQANHDILTNLPNQRLLPQYINEAIEIAKVQHTEFALVSFSLNRVEMITDSLGPEASNTIIESVANRLSILSQLAKQINDSCEYYVTISRKDTFNIVLSPLPAEAAKPKINNLFSVLDEAFYLEKREIKMTASIGVSFYPQDAEDAYSLLSMAEAAMLQAKHYGGNRLEFYRKEINAQTSKLFAIENDLYEALRNNQFQLYYQPLVDVPTARIVGMEALLRWVHPEHGFISPGVFVPVAEETGLIVPIGEWVLREAFRQTKVWHKMGYDYLKVSVNLAEKQLREEGISKLIVSLLNEYDLDRKFIDLEITETGILDEKTIPVIKELKDMGFALVVDDFGTGYSGLSYLKRFAIDKLKIDQSFIRDIPESIDSIAIVSAIIAMANELKIATLAEGIETPEQLEFLRKKGCNYGQGYLFSKPLEDKFFTQLLATQEAEVPL